MFEIYSQNLLSQTSELANQVIIQCFFPLLDFDICFYFPFICTDDTKYCNHGNDLLLRCDTGALQMIIFQVDGPHEFRVCSMQVVSGCPLLVVARFNSFLVHSRSLHVVSFLLKVVPNHFRLFLASCRLFQVISCSLQVVSCSLQVVFGRFAFQ